MTKEIEKIDASEPGRVMHTYRIGTVPTTSGMRAYTEDYNPSWDGCVEYDVVAPNEYEARKAAIKARKERRD